MRIEHKALLALAGAAAVLSTASLANAAMQKSSDAQGLAVIEAASPSTSPSPSDSPIPSPSPMDATVPVTLPPIVITTTTTHAPKPTTHAPQPKPTTKKPPTNAYYKNCTAAWAAGAAPLHRGEPGYRSALDRDHDGVACEDRP